MQYQKISPLRNRQSILSELKLRLERELADHNGVLTTLAKVRGMSPADVEYGVAQTRQAIRDLESLLKKIDELLYNEESAHLMIFQQTYGKEPEAQDGFYLGTDQPKLWQGTKNVLLRSEFYEKPVGSQWSALHAQAEVNEFFHLYERI